MDAGRIDTSYHRDRRRLIEGLQSGGLLDLAVLHAFDVVPRHMFVPDAVRHRAYEDTALPLDHGQTISRPAVHALHLSLAKFQGSEKVLEVGTGSGYQTALLSQLAGRVYSIETVPELAQAARGRLSDLGLMNVILRTGDGSAGWPEEAPFDVILVGAAAPRVPQSLLRITCDADGAVEEEEIDAAQFVPLIGREGW